MHSHSLYQTGLNYTNKIINSTIGYIILIITFGKSTKKEFLKKQTQKINQNEKIIKPSYRSNVIICIKS